MNLRERTRAMGGRWVLVVDDEPALCTVIASYLRPVGFEVVTVAGGHAALEASAAMPHLDVVITDLEMPNFDGVDLVDELARTRTGFRALFVSGLPADAQQAARRSPIPAAFLAKPFTQNELLATLDRLLVEAVGSGVRLG